MKASERAMKLWNQMETYSDDDFNFLKKYIKKKKYKVKYAFYTPISNTGKQIALIFDLIPNQPRKSGVENKWKIISTREMTEKEIEEYIIFYFRETSQRFWVFYYKNIEKLIYDDQKLKAITPEKFIEECHKKGYSGAFQLKIELI